MSTLKNKRTTKDALKELCVARKQLAKTIDNQTQNSEGSKVLLEMFTQTIAELETKIADELTVYLGIHKSIVER